MSTKARQYTAHGTKIALYPMRDVRAVVLKVMFFSGSHVEPGEHWGAMHLLEHMTHDGTERFPTQLDIEYFKEEHGIKGNAFTGTYALGYWYECPDSSLEQAVALFEEIVFRPRLPEEQLVKELRVIRQEYTDKWSDPYTRYGKSLDRHFLGKDNLSVRDGIGQPEYIETLSREDLVRLWQKHMVTGNMVLSLAGSFDEAHAKSLIEAVLGKYKKGTKKAMHFSKSKQEIDYLWHKEDVDQVGINLYWPTPGRDTLSLCDQYAHGIAAYLIGGSPRSRLFRKLRYDESLVYRTGARWHSYPVGGAFSAYASTNPESAGVTLSLMRETIGEFVDKGPTAEEFDRAKRYLSTQLLLSYDSVDSIAEELVDDLFWEGRIISPEERIAILKKVTPKDVRTTTAVLGSREPFVGALAKDDPKLL